MRKDDHICGENGNLEFRRSFLDYFKLYGLKTCALTILELNWHQQFVDKKKQILENLSSSVRVVHTVTLYYLTHVRVSLIRLE